MEVVEIKTNQYLLAGSPNGVNDSLGTGEPLGRELDDDF